MRRGIHMPLTGGFENNIRRLKKFGCETVQVFPGNPTGWAMAPADPAEAAARADFLEGEEIFPLVIHCAYLINLATPSPGFLEKSRLLLKATMEKAALYRAPFVVLHTGNHGGRGEEEGLDAVTAVLAEEMPRWPEGVTLLLENTAGSGTALGSRFEELARLVLAFPPASLGVCLDTAHAFAAGYDFGSARGTETALESFDRTVGLDRLKAIHVNGSKSALGSRVDRHAHLDEGRLGLEGLRTLLRQPWPAGFPFILETPEIGTDRDRTNLEILLSLS